MPLPLPPSSSSSATPTPAWFSVSRWFGGAKQPPAATRSRVSAGDEGEMEALRTQARRRLIGAVVLLAVGVVAFPLLFETEPRPMGVDTPMQRAQGTVSSAAVSEPPPLAERETAAAPALESQTPTGPAAAETPAPEPVVEASKAPTASPEPAGPTVTSAASPVVKPALKPPEAPAVKPTAPAAPTAAPPAAQQEQAQRAEAQRARALLEGRSAAAPTVPAATAPVVAARFVVQVGAFTEKRALADARSRVERLGLKTYTQVITSPAGPRTRVRVGPFDSRAEADAAAAKLRAAGLPAAILTL